MHVLVLDTNCVDTHFLGDELNAVVVVIQTDNVTEFCQARGLVTEAVMSKGLVPGILRLSSH